MWPEAVAQTATSKIHQNRIYPETATIASEAILLFEKYKKFKNWYFKVYKIYPLLDNFSVVSSTLVLFEYFWKVVYSKVMFLAE